MIKIGISGGETPRAGELIRLLVNHPDVKISTIVANKMSGCAVTSVHHGLIGECALDFDAQLITDKLQVLFVAADAQDARSEIPSPQDNAELCVIDMTADFNRARQQDSLIVYGVPEINRKALVRGAKRAIVPSPLESVLAVALQPLAMRSMIPDSLEIQIEAAAEIIHELPSNLDSLIAELKNLGNNQFKLKTDFEPRDLGRVIRISTQLALPVPLDNIIDMYEELYEDHNLTFIVGDEPAPAEVEGTDKCIIYLDKTAEGKLHLQAIADARMRGGAGDAVHIMNLLMGLYEKTGLNCKASQY